MIIAVDFDGVLHDGTYPQIGNAITEAVECIRYAAAQGHDIILYTCRDGKLLLDAINWCLGHGIILAAVNENLQSNIKQYGNNSRKIYADMYIDSNQVGRLPQWSVIKDTIMESQI